MYDTNFFWRPPAGEPTSPKNVLVVAVRYVICVALKLFSFNKKNEFLEAKRMFSRVRLCHMCCFVFS